MSHPINDEVYEYRLENCLCLECGEHSVNMEDGVEVCDSCKN